MKRLLAEIGQALSGMPPWAKAGAALLLMSALVRGRMKAGCAIFLGALVLAMASPELRELEPFVNALNLAATGKSTVRLLATLLALAWLGEILWEGAAGRLLEEGIQGLAGNSRARDLILPAVAGLMPGGRPVAGATGLPEDLRAALSLWFSKAPALALPLGAGFVVACDLGHLSLGQAAALLAPLALAMGAVGLLTLARDLPEPAGGEASAAPARGEAFRKLAFALCPILLALAGAFGLAQTSVPVVRASDSLHRIGEGVWGLMPPLAIGCLMGGILAGRLLGLSVGTLWRAMKRVSTSDLVVFAVGIKFLEQAASGVFGSDLARSLPTGGGGLASMAALALPALLAFGMGGAAEGLACTLPFLLPWMGAPADPRLLMLSLAGASLGGMLARRPLEEWLEKGGTRTTVGELRWRLALPAALTALLAALLHIAG